MIHMKLFEIRSQFLYYFQRKMIRQCDLQAKEGYSRFAGTYVQNLDIFIVDILDQVHDWSTRKTEIIFRLMI